ncbi:hypothetical protein ACWDOP_35835 [Nocardia sp. NPDC003693]
MNDVGEAELWRRFTDIGWTDAEGLSDEIELWTGPFATSGSSVRLADVSGRLATTLRDLHGVPDPQHLTFYGHLPTDGCPTSIANSVLHVGHFAPRVPKKDLSHRDVGTQIHTLNSA